MISGLSRLRRLSGRQRRDLTIAVFELLWARVRFAALPYDRLLSGLQSRVPSSRLEARGRCSSGETLAEIAWAIAAAARRVPWRADCLVQALAADRWLKRLGFVPEFSLGVMKDDHGDLRAHAWIRCESVTVTGDGHDSFSALIEPKPEA